MGRLLWARKISGTYDSVPFPISYTAASSLSLPTKRRCPGLLDSNIVVNTFGDNLHPQPALKLKTLYLRSFFLI
jgi:hypothetical protein